MIGSKVKGKRIDKNIIEGDYEEKEQDENNRKVD